MWPEDFWPDDYWEADYWPKEGGEPPVGGGDGGNIGIGQKKSFSMEPELGGGSW